MAQNLVYGVYKDKAAEQRRRIEVLLDQGLGCCLLKRPDVAEIVEDALLFGDGARYLLPAWVVMPNHVHVLIEQMEGWPLAKVIQSWKRHTVKMIKELGYGDLPPKIWQRDYWDRYVRNNKHYRTVVGYIEQNPVQAGLVAKAEDWPWGSARFGPKGRDH